MCHPSPLLSHPHRVMTIILFFESVVFGMFVSAVGGGLVSNVASCWGGGRGEPLC